MKAAFRPRAILQLVLISMVVLAGCRLPVDTPPPVAEVTEEDQNLQFTAAVETLTARLTEEIPPTALPASPTIEAATATSEPTATTAPTATATGAPSTPTATTPPTLAPSATLASTDPRVNLGSPTFHEPFDNDTNWGFLRDEHSDMVINNGMLEMTSFNSDGWDSWTITWVNGEDFYTELTGTFGACSGLDRFGIMFAARQDASEGYLFGISCDGRYSLRTWDGERYTRLVDWTASDLINDGANQTNRLGVWKDDDTIRLYVNGSLLKEIDDESYDEGHVGVWVGSVNTEDFTVKVDLLDWWDL